MKNEKINIMSKALQRCTTSDQILDAFFNFVQSSGIAKIAYHHMAPHQATDFNEKRFIARGYEEEKVSAYNRNHKFFNCPFSEYAQSSSQALTIQEAAKVLRFASAQKEYLRKFYISEHSTGLVIPVFGLKGRNGVFILTANSVSRTHAPSEIRLLKSACQEVHHKICEIVLGKAKQDISLTARETEILTWVARGKSNSIIADIVGISPHTVNGYLRSVYLKTGVCDRTSAALVGVSKALINI